MLKVVHLPYQCCAPLSQYVRACHQIGYFRIKASNSDATPILGDLGLFHSHQRGFINQFKSRGNFCGPRDRFIHTISKVICYALGQRIFKLFGDCKIHKSKSSTAETLHQGDDKMLQELIHIPFIIVDFTKYLLSYPSPKDTKASCSLPENTHCNIELC